MLQETYLINGLFGEKGLKNKGCLHQNKVKRSFEDMSLYVYVSVCLYASVLPHFTFHVFLVDQMV